MARNVKDGSQFTAPIMKAAKAHARSATNGICPICAGEFVTGPAGTVDHKLAFKLAEFAADCGLEFIGQRENAMLICSHCNERKGKKEQRLTERRARGEDIRADVVALFMWADKKSQATMGKRALKNRVKALREIETSTREKKAATAALTEAKKGDDEKAIARAARKEFQIAHRRANQRRATKGRKVVNFT